MESRKQILELTPFERRGVIIGQYLLVLGANSNLLDLSAGPSAELRKNQRSLDSKNKEIKQKERWHKS